MKRLILNKETLRKLENRELEGAGGGRPCATTKLPCKDSVIAPSFFRPCL